MAAHGKWSLLHRVRNQPKKHKICLSSGHTNCIYAHIRKSTNIFVIDNCRPLYLSTFYIHIYETLRVSTRSKFEETQFAKENSTQMESHIVILTSQTGKHTQLREHSSNPHRVCKSGRLLQLPPLGRTYKDWYLM